MPAWAKAWPQSHGTGEESADKHERFVEEEKSQPASQPPWTTQEPMGEVLNAIASRGGRHWTDSPSSQETSLREVPVLGYSQCAAGRKQYVSRFLRSQWLVATTVWINLGCACLCEECARASMTPSAPTLEAYAKELLPAGCPLPNTAGCKPQRRESPASAQGLGNEVTNHQVGGRTRGAFQIPVTERHLMALPGIP